MTLHHRAPPGQTQFLLGLGRLAAALLRQRRAGSIRRAFCSVLGAFVLLPYAMHAQAEPFAYVPSFTFGKVSVIDTADQRVVTTVPVGIWPVNVAVNPVRPRVYVANTYSDSVSVIDTTSHTLLATVSAGDSPNAIAVDAAGDRVYVAAMYDNKISVIDAASNQVIASVPTATWPSGIALNPAGTLAYVTHSSDPTMSIVDTTSNTVVDRVRLGSNALSIAINRAGTRAYIGGYSSVMVFDTTSRSVLTSIAVGNTPLDIAVHPNGKTVYTSNRDSNTVSVIDTATNTVVATVPVDTRPQGIAVHPDGLRVYVTSEDLNTVSVINVASNTVVQKVAVPDRPFARGMFIGGTPQEPGAPALTGAVPGDAQMALNWSAPADEGSSPITGYTVTASPGAATCSATVPETTCTVTGLANGTEYQFTVTASNAIGSGPASAPLAATPSLPAQAPDAPTLTDALVGNAQVELRWSAPASDNGSPITSYTVTSQPGSSGCSAVPPAMACTVTGLANGTAYQFTATASNAIGPGPASPPLAATPSLPPQAPDAPVLTDALASNGQVELHWSAPAHDNGSPITSYRVISMPSSAGCSAVAPALSCTVTGLTNGTEYKFSVTANNAIGPGPASAPLSATPAAPPGAPTPVPTLSQWGLMLLSGLMLALAVVAPRRQQWLKWE